MPAVLNVSLLVSSAKSSESYRTIYLLKPSVARPGQARSFFSHMFDDHDWSTSQPQPSILLEYSITNKVVRMVYVWKLRLVPLYVKQRGLSGSWAGPVESGGES
jgi:hypothetical protein